MLNKRFDRDYELKIKVDSREITIRPPIRIFFDGKKSADSDLNTCNIEIYNLVEDKRNALVKDVSEKVNIPVELKVGYRNHWGKGYRGGLMQFFKGNVNIGSTSKVFTDSQRRTTGINYVTRLECFDGGFALQTSQTSATLTKRDEAFRQLAADMNGITTGYITEPEESLRPLVLVGNTFDVLSKQLQDDETYFIDAEKLYITKVSEPVPTLDFVPYVCYTTGLQNTPELKGKTLSFQTLINPEINIGGRVELRSENAPQLNGLYYIKQFTYKGDYDGTEWYQICEGEVSN